MYQVVKNYRNDERLRHSFNELAKKTFYINFEDWYQNGYWTDRYNPYSIVIEGKVVANVSVNITDFDVNGEDKHFIQLGTVMTDEQYRNQGLIRIIMEEIDKDYADRVDGMYLFANNDVLSFYPKFGFRAVKQYEYVKEVKVPAQQIFTPVPMKDKKSWDMLENKIRTCCKQSAFEMIDNSQLNMFYVSKYMQENVFYSETLDTYVIAETDNNILTIDMVISDKEQDLNRIAHGFGEKIQHVILGFTPKDVQGFEVREMDQDDRTLHIKGDLAVMEKNKLMFPLLAHA